MSPTKTLKFQYYIIRHSLFCSMLSFLSKIFGFLKSQMILWLFGNKPWQLDAFTSAFRLPNALREMFSEGAFSVAFTQSFIGILATKPILAMSFARCVGKQLLLCSFALALLLAMSTSLWMKAYHQNIQFPEATMLSTQLFQITIFYLPIMSACSILMGMSHGFHRFIKPAGAPLLSNIIFMIVTMSLASHCGIFSLPIACLAGGMSIFALLPKKHPEMLIAKTLNIHQQTILKNKIKEFWMLFYPMSFAMGIPKISFLMLNCHSSGLLGANVALGESIFLTQLPISIFIVSLSSIIFSTLSKVITHSNGKQEAQKILTNAFRLTIIFMLPCIVIYFSLGSVIARFLYMDLPLLFGWNPNPEALQHRLTLTKNIESIMSFMFVLPLSTSFNILWTRWIQGLRLTKKLIFPGIMSVLFNALALWLWSQSPNSGLPGLASICVTTSCFHLLALSGIGIKLMPNHRKFIQLIGKTGTRTFLASILLISTFWILEYVMPQHSIPTVEPENHAMLTIAKILTGVIIYCVGLYIFAKSDLQHFWEEFKK